MGNNGGENYNWPSLLPGVSCQAAAKGGTIRWSPRTKKESWELGDVKAASFYTHRERSVEVPLESSVAHVCKNYCPELEKEPLEMVRGNYPQCSHRAQNISCSHHSK